MYTATIYTRAGNRVMYVDDLKFSKPFPVSWWWWGGMKKKWEKRSDLIA